MTVDLRFRGNIRIATSVTASAITPVHLVVRNPAKGNTGKLMFKGVFLPARTILSLRQGRFSFTPIQAQTELQPSGRGFAPVANGQLYPRSKFNTREVITTNSPVFSGSNPFIPPTIVFRYAVGDSLATGFTFTRALAATYNDITGSVKTIGIGLPRDQHFMSGSQSLLLEPPRTNYLLQSTDFTNVAWSLSNFPVITANQFLSPDFATLACQVAFPAVSAGGNQFLFQNPAGQSATTKTLSLYARGKLGTETIYQMTTPDLTTFQTRKDSLLTTWQRFSATSSAASALYCELGINLTDVTQTSTPAQTSSLWGAQLESGSWPTSLILNTTVSQTRPADVLNQTILGGAAQFGTLYEKYIDLATNTFIEQTSLLTTNSTFNPGYGRAWFAWKFALGSQSLSLMQGV